MTTRHRLVVRSLPRILAVGLAAAAAAVPPPACWSAASDLDSTFGGGGIVTTELSDGLDLAAAIAVQPDGKIVVAGRSLPESGPVNGLSLARYLPDGALDRTFGSGGTVRAALGGRSGYARDVAVDSRGRIVVAGTQYVGASGRDTLVNDAAVARLLPDGRFDSSFGHDGLATAHFGDRVSVAEAVLIQPDGKIVAAGRSYRYRIFDDQPLVARFEPDGSLDAAFGQGGTVSPGQGFGIWGAALEPDGRIVLAGSTSGEVVTTLRNLVLVRLLTDGRPDPSFGQGGIVVADLDGRGDQGRKVEVLGDGRILAGAFIVGPANEPEVFALARFDPDGARDASFGVEGLATAASAGSACSDGPGVAIQPDGAVVMAGEKEFGAVRFDAGGSVDPSFAPDRAAFAGSDNVACAVDVAVQPDGAVVVAGSQFYRNNERARFMAARFEGQAPTLSAEATNPWPLPGESVVLTFTIGGSPFAAFSGGRLTVTIPAELAADPGAPATVDPPDAGRVAPGYCVVDQIAVAAGGSVRVSVPVLVRPNTGPTGLTLTATAVLEPGPGHSPASAAVRLILEGPPIAEPDHALTARDTPVVVRVLANDREAAGLPLHLMDVAQPSSGVTTFDPHGTVTYTPAAGYVGSDAFDYWVANGYGVSTARADVVVAERLVRKYLPLTVTRRAEQTVAAAYPAGSTARKEHLPAVASAIAADRAGHSLAGTSSTRSTVAP